MSVVVEGLSIVVSLADNSALTCRLQLDLTTPNELIYFTDAVGNGLPVYRWNSQLADNGPAAGDRGGQRRGAGGHLTAPIAGYYTLTVRRQDPTNTAECHYRLFAGSAFHYSTPRPAW